MPKNMTGVCDKNGRCVIGAFHPAGTGSAHERLAKAVGMDPVVGGYFDSNGNIGYNSESINRFKMNGDCSAEGTPAGEMMRKNFESGNYERRHRK